MEIPDITIQTSETTINTTTHKTSKHPREAASLGISKKGMINLDGLQVAYLGSAVLLK